MVKRKYHSSTLSSLVWSKRCEKQLILWSSPTISWVVCLLVHTYKSFLHASNSHTIVQFFKATLETMLQDKHWTFDHSYQSVLCCAGLFVWPAGCVWPAQRKPHWAQTNPESAKTIIKLHCVWGICYAELQSKHLWKRLTKCRRRVPVIVWLKSEAQSSSRMSEPDVP